jgi:hypothetical protein
MNYFERLSLTRYSYISAVRELAWRSCARIRGWLEYGNSLPWHWGVSRWVWFRLYNFKHGKEVTPTFPKSPPLSILSSSGGDGDWGVNAVVNYTRELRDGEPLSHAQRVNLFALEKAWGKKIIVGRWMLGKLYSPDEPHYISYGDYVAEGEKGRMNTHPDELLGWEHIEYAKVIFVWKES